VSDRRLFDPAVLTEATALYKLVQDTPIFSPHGHVNPRLFTAESYDWGTPVDLLIMPDHYLFRMLYSQGIPLTQLGIPSQTGGDVERDHRKIWQLFADHFYLFRATPSAIWLADQFQRVFGLQTPLLPTNAQSHYDAIAEQLTRPEFTPRRLYERFNIALLATTDFASDPLTDHRAIRDSGWAGQVIPTFRPDDVVNFEHPTWRKNIEALADLTDGGVKDYASYIQALEQRRSTFKTLGAKATDHGVVSAYTGHLTATESDAIFQRALMGQATAEDATRFRGHMLLEMARMSIEDGLVMQLHVGVYRDHHTRAYTQFGHNIGADIPIQMEFTHNLHALLNAYGHDPRLRLIVFTLDESSYSRELAPLAGYYPALKLGPPWWFHDSLNGMRRYFDQVIETAGLYNTVGFNDDTRAFPSIPARHDVWRRASANWLAGLLVRGILHEDEAQAMIYELAYGLAQRAYQGGTNE
jgi:glucuronate isomerase